MPGLVGFVKDLSPDQARSLLETMARALEPEPRFSTHLHQDGPCGLGRVSLGILNPETQPIWNAEKDICLVMEGEIYDYQAQRQALIERGYRFVIDNDAEFALHLYQEYGDTFAARLNGAFSIAIWDRRQQKLVVTNDHLGLYPLYYAQTGDGLIFGSGVRALLGDQSLPRKVDGAAIAQFLTFDHVLSDHTLLSAVKLMPQASVLTYQGRQLDIYPYWKLQYTDAHPLRSEAEFRDQLLFYLRQAIARCAHDDLPTGLLLSGGLDSRVLLGMMAEVLKGDQFATFTWGIPGCDDARFARELSSAAGVRHYFFELTPDWLLAKAGEAVRVTDGLGNIVNLHALATADQESQYAKVIYKGFLGDALLGFAISRRFWGDYDEATRIQVHWQEHRDIGVIFLESADYPVVFTDAFRTEIGDAVMEDYRAGMGAAQADQLAQQRLFFDMTQRVPRMTIKGVEVVRSQAEARLPFCDRDLVEFTAQIPLGYLCERRLIVQAFVHAYPDLAKIPCTPSNLPMIFCARDVVERAKRLAQWHLRQRGLARLAGPEKRPYRDYTLWFRTVLRRWVEETLVSPQALNRGYFKPEYVRRIVEEHMAGANHTIRLGALLSLELWHRQFVD